MLCPLLPVRRPAEEREEAVAAVLKKLPKRVKRKRPVQAEDGTEVGAGGWGVGVA